MYIKETRLTDCEINRMCPWVLSGFCTFFLLKFRNKNLNLVLLLTDVLTRFSADLSHFSFCSYVTNSLVLKGISAMEQEKRKGKG